MAKLARVVVPDCPHHVTQRGNRRQSTFFEDDDCQAYLELMAHRRYTRRGNVREGWRAFLSQPTEAEYGELLRPRERTGRVLGSESFLAKIEGKLGRSLRPKKTGRPRKQAK